MRLKLTLVIALLTGCAVFGAQVFAQPANKTVYVDPFFGGKENGPSIAHKISAKKITLDTGQKLRQQLGKENIDTILSRDRDTFVTLDQRTTMARSRGSSVYIAINVIKAKKDCILLYYPQQTQSKPQKATQDIKELGKAIDTMISEERVKKSGQLAEAIYNSIKQRPISVCLEKQPGAGDINYDTRYILENAYAPVVIVSFGVSNSASPYALDSDLMDKIISAVSAGIKDYFTALQPTK